MQKRTQRIGFFSLSAVFFVLAAVFVGIVYTKAARAEQDWEASARQILGASGVKGGPSGGPICLADETPPLSNPPLRS